MDDDWRGFYKEGWQGEIIPEAFSHPAKFARGLIRQIYSHMLAEDWLREGNTVIDPFGGVALGGLDAMANGLHWVGVELEPRFMDLGNKNIALWNDCYGDKLPHWGTARLVQGDSRELLAVLEVACDGCVSSPPYANSISNQSEILEKVYSKNQWGGIIYPRHYSHNSNNLGNLPATDSGFDAAVSSPPYAESISAHKSGIDWTKGHNGRDFTKELAHKREREQMGLSYGTTSGQIGAMRADGFNSAVSSPPYAQTRFDGGRIAREDGYTGLAPYSGEAPDTWATKRDQTNLGNNDESDFWLAARQIIEQTYAVLRPGAHACWVVKAFVKNKKRVDFPDQWQRLCEAVGFRTVHIHRAWLVEERGTQIDLLGNHHVKRTERKSFFRRLAEKKGSPRIDYEIVLCQVK